MIINNSSTVHSTFYQPMFAVYESAKHKRDCPSLPDIEWLEHCVSRVLSQEASGRGFLQRLLDCEDRDLPISTYFDANATKRRYSLLREVNAAVGKALRCHDKADPLSLISSLDGYDVYAGDGHYHAASTHDEPIDGKRRAIGHFFGLDLRSHELFPLALADLTARKREHDMRALKRLEIDELRRGAPAGQKVIWVWDRAGIDAAQWQKWKQNNGIYFISRTKENMKLTTMGELEYDHDDPNNAGVIAYRLVQVGGQALRCVDYRDPATGVEYSFLTSLTEIEPGIIAALYKIRWDIEKVFDETKTKLGEKKGWGSSDVAKKTQAEAICLTHNLMVHMERQIKATEDMEPEDDAKRRMDRLESDQESAQKRAMKVAPIIAQLALRVTQRGVRFIRWLRNHIGRKTALQAALVKLRVVWGLNGS